MIQCPAPADLDLAQKTPPAGKTTFTYDDETVYTCNSGYAIDPTDKTTTSQTVKCLDTGSWASTSACQGLSSSNSTSTHAYLGLDELFDVSLVVS